MKSVRELASVAVVVVTYNSADLLKDCLQSLSDGCRGTRLVEVVVADNASSDESVSIAENLSELPVTVVQLGRNAGYAAAVNAAVARLDLPALDAVLVLNPDTRVRPDAVASLADVLRHAGRGIAVPKLVDAEGALVPSLRRTPTLLRALGQAVAGGPAVGGSARFGELITDPEHYRQAGPASWATGAAMLIATAAIGDVGDWDESFLLYSEEVDYALRAADRGWALWYEPEAVVEHIGGESGTNPTLAALLAVNRVALYRKRHGRLASAAHFACVALGEALRAAAGRQISRAALRALLRPSTRIRVLPVPGGETAGPADARASS